MKCITCSGKGLVLSQDYGDVRFWISCENCNGYGDTN